MSVIVIFVAIVVAVVPIIAAVKLVVVAVLAVSLGNALFAHGDSPMGEFDHREKRNSPTRDLPMGDLPTIIYTTAYLILNLT